MDGLHVDILLHSRLAVKVPERLGQVHGIILYCHPTPPPASAPLARSAPASRSNPPPSTKYSTLKSPAGRSSGSRSSSTRTMGNAFGLGGFVVAVYDVGSEGVGEGGAGGLDRCCFCGNRGRGWRRPFRGPGGQRPGRRR